MKASTGAALAFAAAAALIALAVRARQPQRSTFHPGSKRSRAERSLTMQKREAEELRGLWEDPKMLRRILARFAEIDVQSATSTLWRSGGYQWTMRRDETAEDCVRWVPDGDAPVRQFEARFSHATGREGTLVTLALELDPPGAFERAGAQLFGGAVSSAMAISILHVFKAFVETGEIPNTDHQPAARRDPR